MYLYCTNTSASLNWKVKFTMIITIQNKINKYENNHLGRSLCLLKMEGKRAEMVPTGVRTPSG